MAIFLWRKIDYPGTDICRLFNHANGWRLTGAAIFRENDLPCHLEYEVTADATFRTSSATVSGHVGKKAVTLRISSTGNARWQFNGVSKQNVTGCIDVDLGFTPATNLIAIRRLALKVGQHADAPAAYLQFPELKLVKLEQSYRRIGRTAYEYKSPAHGYSGTLKVLPSGAVSHYPGLFELVGSG